MEMYTDIAIQVQGAARKRALEADTNIEFQGYSYVWDEAVAQLAANHPEDSESCSGMNFVASQ